MIRGEHPVLLALLEPLVVAPVPSCGARDLVLRDGRGVKRPQLRDRADDVRPVAPRGLDRVAVQGQGEELQQLLQLVNSAQRLDAITVEVQRLQIQESQQFGLYRGELIEREV